MTVKARKFRARWAKGLIARLSIAKKITSGYALAIGIAVFGTSIGLEIGEYYEKQAYKQLILAEYQESLLKDLKNAVLTIRVHPQELVTVLEDSIWFLYETSKLKTDVNQTQVFLSEIEDFIEDNPTYIAGEPTEFKEILQGYKQTTNLYLKLMESLWQEIEPMNLTASEITGAQQKVLSAIAGEEAIKIRLQFERLSESLIAIEKVAERQQKQANDRLIKAKYLRRQIIISSMILSVSIAVWLAISTSRAIAQPLEAVTKVAQQVTKESNFDLQATVTTADEVGLLAISLNQLIQWVGEYTDELEQSRQTLEQRVEERTSELKQALQNLKQTQSQLIQTEKMSSLGQMVAGVAHEINNPVTFVYGNLNHVEGYSQDLLSVIELYQQYYPESPDEIQDILEEIEIDFVKEDLPKVLFSMKEGANRIAEIVKSLRTFSRLDEAEFKQADLHAGIDSTLMILENKLKFKSDSPAIQVMKEYGQVPLVYCYAGQLNQVFMNLIANAIDAIDENNKLRNIEEIKANPSIIKIHTSRENNWVEIRIADNGPGIPEDIRNKLFDPFFTTKPVGKGTGLGLSISYQIVVDKHRGQIECHSSPGKGTEFVVKIPIKQPQ
ncbi:MAG: sensor histidine kinase [Hormoscilla sp.]